jgi:hypothetical protein
MFEYGNNEKRANAKTPARDGIDMRVAFCVVAALRFVGL